MFQMKPMMQLRGQRSSCCQGGDVVIPWSSFGFCFVDAEEAQRGGEALIVIRQQQ